jgi:hypothetical protein
MPNVRDWLNAIGTRMLATQAQRVWPAFNSAT